MDWDRIGEGSHPSLNPPALEASDRFALRFYNDHATEFIKEFGLMPNMFKDLGLDKAGETVLVRKLSRIFQAHSIIQSKEQEKALRKA